MALGVVAGDAGPAGTGTGATGVAEGSAIPFGDSPGLFPGMAGWKPSGRGKTIPEAELDGAPRGLWWAPRMDGFKTTCRIFVFLPDGTYADGPRPGGPWLVDLEGQSAEKGYTGVGTFEVSGDSITMSHDGFSSTDPFSVGEDDTSEYFMIGQMKHRPISPVSRDGLIGAWKSAGSRYVFHDDGTFEMGQVALEVGAGASYRGKWTLDGYLLMLEPSQGPGWISFVGATVGGRFLIVGNVLHSREP
jgi:hypothetical protein